MSNNLKQVYASLFIDENQLQVLVAEYFGSRFNVIRAEKVKMEGILNFKVSNYERAVEIIKNTVDNLSKKIGATIQKVILVLPAYNFERYPLRVSVIPKGGIITKNDIAKALSSSLNTKVDDRKLIVNASIIKYVVNGITSRRMPEKEISDEVLVDIDLLCADKEMCYDYVKVLNEAGLQVLDITLNSYSIGKEAVLIENSLNNNIILLDIGDVHTYLTLFSKGKLITTDFIHEGLNKIYDEVSNNLQIPQENIARLVKYNVNYNSSNKEDAVFAWGDEKKNYSITVEELSNCVKQPLQDYIEKLLTMCKPITETGETSFVITGEGAKMNTLCEQLAYYTNCNVNAYYPDTLGVRDSAYAALFGSLYVYREKAMLNDLNVFCLDIAEYDSTVDLKKIDVEGESITMKIKKIFESIRDKENEYGK